MSNVVAWFVGVDSVVEGDLMCQSEVELRASWVDVKGSGDGHIYDGYLMRSTRSTWGRTQGRRAKGKATMAYVRSSNVLSIFGRYDGLSLDYS